LIRALEAGALCTVARTKKWKPEKNDEVWLYEKGYVPVKLAIV
jgi:hypothetical protein